MNYQLTHELTGKKESFTMKCGEGAATPQI